MATSTPINSSALIIRISSDNGTTWDLIGFANAATLSRSMETRDITNKFSCGWKKIGEGKLSWNLNGEGFITYVAVSGATDPLQLHQLWASRKEIDIEFTTWDCAAAKPIPGDPNYRGKAFLTSLEETGAVEDNGVYSFTFEGSDELVDDVNP